MIVRTWRAKIAPANMEKYERHFRERVLPKLRKVDGHRGVHLLRRDAGAHIELLVLTMWDSMQTVRGFAGDTPDQAVVEPDAQAVLDQFDAFVHHYEAVDLT